MLIRVTGFNKQRKQLIQRALKHFVSRLVERDISRHIVINVMRAPASEEFIATCGPISDCSREFDLDIYGHHSDRELLSTLAHEAVHIKQFATFQLRNLRSPHLSRFANRNYDKRVIEYLDLPWEIEAHNMEEELARSFNEAD